MKRKLILLLCAILCALSLPTGAHAQTIGEVQAGTQEQMIIPNSGGTIAYHEVDGVVLTSEEESVLWAMPRFKYLSVAGAGISSSGRIVTCSGIATIDYTEYETQITISIQERKTGSSNWSTKHTWSTESFQGDGTHFIQGTWQGRSGYEYRTKAIISVNLNGMTRESTISYSPTESL